MNGFTITVSYGALIFFIFIGFCFDAQAQDLKKDQQFNTSYILTELGSLQKEIEDLKSQKPENKNVGYNGGFFIKSDDGQFRLQFNGRVQVRYAFNIAESNENGHTISLRRAYLNFSGHAFNDKAKFLFVLAPSAPSSLVEFDAGYQFHDIFSIHAVYTRILFTGEGGESSGKLIFIGRSMVANRYEIGGTFGVIAEGRYGLFNYSGGVFNGLDTGFGPNKNNEMAYALRLDLDLINKVSVGQSDVGCSKKPSLSFGVGGIWGYYEDNTQARVIMGASDIRFKYRGFSFYGGGVYRQTDLDIFSRAQTDLGYVIQAGYFLIPKKLEFALRTAALIDDIDNAGVNLKMKAGDITRLGGNLSGGDVGQDSANEFEYTAGLNYYFKGYNAKIQAQYTLMFDGQDNGDALMNHIGLVQVQLGF